MSLNPLNARPDTECKVIMLASISRSGSSSGSSGRTNWNRGASGSVSDEIKQQGSILSLLAP